MNNILTIIFSLNLALLSVHEMEAIRYQEWKMFLILKDMEDKKAYMMFLLLHIPLYTILILLLYSTYYMLAVYIVDVFLIAHLILHLCFTKHVNNKLSNKLSMSIIAVMGILSVIHLIGILI